MKATLKFPIECGQYTCQVDGQDRFCRYLRVDVEEFALICGLLGRVLQDKAEGRGQRLPECLGAANV